MYIEKIKDRIVVNGLKYVVEFHEVDETCDGLVYELDSIMFMDSVEPMENSEMDKAYENNTPDVIIDVLEDTWSATFRRPYKGRIW